MEKLPTLSYDLVMALDELIPNADPQLTDSDREVWIRKGKRDLVLYLKFLIDSARDQDGLPNVLRE